jgi:thiol-disulfide isomerase/thioredoxin
MKLHFTFSFLLLTLIIHSYRTDAQSGIALLHGAITNGADFEVRLNGYPDSLDKKFNVRGSTFTDTAIVIPGIYSLTIGDEYTDVYLEPGFRIYISLDMNAFDESISYKGRGEIENNYLAQYFLRHEKFMDELRQQKNINESDFIRLTDTFYTNETRKIRELTGTSQQFRYLALHFIDFDKMALYRSFPFMMMQKGENGYTVSDSFPHPEESLNPNNPVLLSVPSYLNSISSLIGAHRRKYMGSHPEKDITMVYLEIMDTLVRNPQVRDQLIRNESRMIIDHSKDKITTGNKLMAMAVTGITRSEISNRLIGWAKLEKGQPSPDFRFADMHGKEYSLMDLKGNIVYIDVWATWCGPCMVEIPELKKITGEFNGKDVRFVSICVQDDKERWEKMVKEKELGGIQLFDPDDNSEFIKSYMIEGIPRFILLDREGKIIDANAIRPSNEGLRKLLESNLLTGK